MGITIKKGDILIVVIVMIFSAFSFLLLLRRKQGNTVIINADGIKKEYSLSKDKTIVLGDKEKQYNTIVIENGYVYMKDASCPDQVCVHHKKIQKEGETIICLPNEVYISIEGIEKTEVDT